MSFDNPWGLKVKKGELPVKRAESEKRRGDSVVRQVAGGGSGW